MASVAIIGAGLIGRSWAIVFARGGWQVRVTDPDPQTLENASRLIREGLKGDETIVISGLQRVRPGAKVTPQAQELPPVRS